MLPYQVIGEGSRTRSYQQDFVITAYYSPLPHQCCYVTGGLEAEKVLNGQGHTAADGTPVYAGMIAAPAKYKFGTVITLQGLGTFKVHDRGGAITELENGADRIDIWVGHGEEALARALAVGVMEVSGRVYPPNVRQPNIAFDMEDLPSPVDRLNAFFVEQDSPLFMRSVMGQKGLSVRMVQESLSKLGYFRRSASGFFGEQTRDSLAGFLRDYDVDGTPEEVGATQRSHIIAATRRKEARKPIQEFVDDTASPEGIMQAQRTLRFLGFYKGRTDGVYSDELRNSILTFQQKHYLVGTESDPGAGRIGPITKRSLEGLWDRTLVAKRAKKYERIHAVDLYMSKHGMRLEKFLEEGHAGSQVRLLQRLLVEDGFFPVDEVNGSFGPLTKEAVIAYQLDRGLIASADQAVAGLVGPKTLLSLRAEKRKELYSKVRADGWRAL